MDAGLLWTAVGSVAGVVSAVLIIWQVRLQVKERRHPLQAGQRGDGVLSTAAAAYALPTDVASFTGRHTELEHVLQVLSDRSATDGVVRIDAIDGLAGIGKTTFAVHVAHRLAARFPDGQIFVHLRGHTVGQLPVEPADALATLLLATGIAAQQIPAGLAARQELWRDRTAGKKLLLVLDDASGSDQVKPLLPGTAQALVLVTSRRRLTALAEALPITLGILTPGEAADLFVQLSQRTGLKATDDGVAEVVALCGYLPLAISLMAGQFKYHNTWTAGSVAADLRSARNRLAHITAENISVAAAFDLSFQDLMADRQRLFRRLGLNPGVDIDAYATAALEDTDIVTARAALDDLYSHHLIEEPTRGRYRFHDLVREYARTRAATSEQRDQEAAMDRLLNYYLCSATTAGHQIDRRVTPRMPSQRLSVAIPELSTREQAIAWMKAERLNLHAAAAYAAQHARSGYAVDLVAVMYGFLHTQGYWEQALDLYRLALGAARDARDKAREAESLVLLGRMEFLTGRFQPGYQDMEQALHLYRDLGDRQGEANTLSHLVGLANAATGDYVSVAADQEHVLQMFIELGDKIGQADTLLSLGLTRGMIGEYAEAAIHEQRALQLYREVGQKTGEANALNNLGWLYMMTGDYDAAIASMERALQLYKDLDIKQGEANVLIDISTLYRIRGDYPAALTAQQRSLQTYRELGDPDGQANALSNLGAAQQMNGDYHAARQSIEQALHLHRSLGETRIGEAQALNNLGELLLATAAPAEALACHERALLIARALLASHEKARALENIGQCHLYNDRPEEAAAALHQAMAIHEHTKSPDAIRIRSILQDHNLE